MELLDDVEQVEEEEDPGGPEARHGHEDEPVPGGDGAPVGGRAH